MHEAIGDTMVMVIFKNKHNIVWYAISLRFHAIIVDNGVLRLNEMQQGERNAQ